jgi:hypothetical protein
LAEDVKDKQEADNDRVSAIAALLSFYCFHMVTKGRRGRRRKNNNNCDICSPSSALILSQLFGWVLHNLQSQHNKERKLDFEQDTNSISFFLLFFSFSKSYIGLGRRDKIILKDAI